MKRYNIYNLQMYKKKAKVLFKHNSFDIIEEGDFVICAISGKKITIDKLNYWDVDLQEAYYSPEEVKIKIQKSKKN